MSLYSCHLGQVSSAGPGLGSTCYISLYVVSKVQRKKAKDHTLSDLADPLKFLGLFYRSHVSQCLKINFLVLSPPPPTLAYTD